MSNFGLPYKNKFSVSNFGLPYENKFSVSNFGLPYKISSLCLILDCPIKISSLSGYKKVIKAPTKSESAEVLIFAKSSDDTRGCK